MAEHTEADLAALKCPRLAVLDLRDCFGLAIPRSVLDSADAQEILRCASVTVEPRMAMALCGAAGAPLLYGVFTKGLCRSATD